MTTTLRPAPRLAPAPLTTGSPVDQQGGCRGQQPLDLGFDPVATAPATPRHVTDAGPVAQRLVQAVLEVFEGQRSPVMLQRACSPTVLGQLARRASARRGTRPGGRPVIRRLRLSHPSPGVCEVAAVVVMSGRVRALACRLVHRSDHWVLDAVELG